MARRTNSSRLVFWRELIERRRRSDLSVMEVCEQGGVSPASFYHWQRKLRGVASPVRNAAPDRDATSRLVPVHVIVDPPIDGDDSAGILEIEMPGEIRLRIHAGCDRALLQLVLGMLLNGGGRGAGSC